MAVDRSKYCHLSSTDNGQVYHTNVHLCRVKLTTRYGDQHAVTKFSKSIVPDKVSEGSEDTQMSIKHALWQVKGSLQAKTRLD